MIIREQKSITTGMRKTDILLGNDYLKLVAALKRTGKEIKTHLEPITFDPAGSASGMPRVRDK